MHLLKQFGSLHRCQLFVSFNLGQLIFGFKRFLFLGGNIFSPHFFDTVFLYEFGSYVRYSKLDWSQEFLDEIKQFISPKHEMKVLVTSSNRRIFKIIWLVNIKQIHQLRDREGH